MEPTKTRVRSSKGTTDGATAAESAAPGGPRDLDLNPQAPSVRSAVIAKAGVRTGDDFANLMSALMSDVLEGAITPMIANATVNAGGKLLKVVEMQYKYGSPKNQQPMVLNLAPGA